jgi:hypothetical protein
VGIYLQERARLSHGGGSSHILLDLDGTDDPTHGDQEGSAYHGYYRHHMYHLLLIFDSETDQHITVVLWIGIVQISRRVAPHLASSHPGDLLRHLIATCYLFRLVIGGPIPTECALPMSDDAPRIHEKTCGTCLLTKTALQRYICDHGYHW